MTTDRKLVAAASALLDSGGEDAVTLRAVGRASGVSHNAPYKHFKNRDALLAAVATTDFAMLANAFKNVRQSKTRPRAKLTNALKVMIEFSYQHRARYQLLFSSPSIAAQRGELGRVALDAFTEFVAIVEQCQAARKLPNVPGATLASLLFATMHGLIAIETIGKLHPEKGLTGVGSSLELLVRLLSRKK